MSKGSWLLLSAALLPGAALASNYFTYSDDALVSPSGWQVVQEANPPTANNEAANSYPYYPVTQATTQKINKSLSSTETTVAVTEEIVSVGCTNSTNCTRTSHPTSVPFSGCSLGYSSVATAMAANFAEWAEASGQPAHSTACGSSGLSACGYMDFTEAAGIADSKVYENCGSSGTCTPQLYDEDDNALPDFVASASTICSESGGYLVAPQDTVVLPPGREYDVPCSSDGCAIGTLVVYEPGDARSCSDTTSFFETFAAINSAALALSGSPVYKTYMQANRIADTVNTAGMCPVGATGWNTDTVLGLVAAWYVGLDESDSDVMSEWDAQLASFDTPVPSKIGIRWDLNTRTESEATTWYAAATSPTQYLGVYIRPDGAAQGGECTVPNQEVAVLTGLTPPC